LRSLDELIAAVPERSGELQRRLGKKFSTDLNKIFIVDKHSSAFVLIERFSELLSISPIRTNIKDLSLNVFQTLGRSVKDIKRFALFSFTNQNLEPALWLLRSELNVLFDFDSKLLTFPILTGINFIKTCLSWPTMKFIKFSKYHTAWPMARFLRNDPPKNPDLTFFPKSFDALIWTGPVRRFLKNRLIKTSRDNTPLFWGLLQGVKRGCLTVDDTFVATSLVDHALILHKEVENHPYESDAYNFTNMLRKLFSEESLLRTYEDYWTSLPQELSQSAAVESMRSEGGAREYIRQTLQEEQGLNTNGISYYEKARPPVKLTSEEWDSIVVDFDLDRSHYLSDAYQINRSFGLKTFFGEPELHSMFETKTGTVETVYSSAPTLRSYVHLKKNFEFNHDTSTDIYSPLIVLEAKVSPVLEPLKVRLITKSNSFQTALSTPMQKTLWSTLSKQSPFVLTSRPLTKTDLFDLVSRESDLKDRIVYFKNLHLWNEDLRVHEDKVIHQAHYKSLHSLFKNADSFWVSGDYSAATDGLNINFTKFIFESILSTLSMSQHSSEQVRSLNRQVLYEQELKYPRRFGVQMMINFAERFPLLPLAFFNALYVDQPPFYTPVSELELPLLEDQTLAALFLRCRSEFYPDLPDPDGFNIAIGYSDPNRSGFPGALTDEWEKDLSMTCSSLSSEMEECPDPMFKKAKPVFSVFQNNGQLMGSNLSFPILCTANILIYWLTLCQYMSKNWIEPDTIRFSDFVSKTNPNKLPVLINGDDILFRANHEFYSLWKENLKLAGFELSIGKNYISREYLTINSECYHVSYDADFEPVNFEKINYMNMGLLLSKSKTGPSTAPNRNGEFLSLSAQYNTVVSTSCDPVRTHRRYIHYNLPTIKRITSIGSSFKAGLSNSGNLNLFAPTHLGGFGFELRPDVRTYVLESMTNKRNTSVFTSRQRQFALARINLLSSFKYSKKVSHSDLASLIKRVSFVSKSKPPSYPTFQKGAVELRFGSGSSPFPLGEWDEVLSDNSQNPLLFREGSHRFDPTYDNVSLPYWNKFFKELRLGKVKNIGDKIDDFHLSEHTSVPILEDHFGVDDLISQIAGAYSLNISELKEYMDMIMYFNQELLVD
jgi:hypothetical protein